MKKVISLFLVIVMLITMTETSFAADSVTIFVETNTTEAAPGEDIVFTVKVANPTGKKIGGIGFNLSISEDLEFKSAEENPESAFVAAEYVPEGKCYQAYGADPGIAETEWTALIITYTVKKTAAGGVKAVTIINDTEEDGGLAVANAEDPDDMIIIVPGAAAEVTVATDTSSSSPVISERYRVEVAKAENGTVSLSSNSASEGSLITVTATPNAGNKVAKVTATQNSAGAEIAVTAVSGTKYTFRMPSGVVTVNVFFECDGTSDFCYSHNLFDVDQNEWYHIAVDYVVSKGLMIGVGDNRFAPDAFMSRAMVIQVLYNMEGAPAVSYTGKFSDVPQGKWYTNAIEWGAANKVVGGYGDVFKPEGDITREEMAAIFYNYVKANGLDTSARSDLSKFSDGNTTSAWAKECMQWAVGCGLMSGYGDNILKPAANASRAEVAQICMNFLKMFG